MTGCERTTDVVEISAEGIGGIDSTTVTLERGVNLLEGRNATNRTSFLQAIMAGIGSDNVTLKGDREEGFVELTVDDETYTRTLRRENGTVRFSGDPYLSDPTEAELFAFLLESNEVRQSVSSGGDLRDVIMRPIDTADIDRQIRDLQKERSEIDDRIERLERKRRQLPSLQGRKRELETKLEDERETLSETKEELEAVDTDVEAKQAEQEQLQTTLEELGTKRSEFDDVRYRLETEREVLESASEELETARTKREGIPEQSEQSLEELEAEIADLRRQKRAYDSRISKLHRLVQFNEEMIDGDGALAELFEQDSGGTVTDELLPATGERTCWTCGSTVETGAFEGMLDRLRELSREQRREREELETELDEVTARREKLEETQQRRQNVAERITSLEADIERRKETIANLETRQTELRAQIDDLEEEAEQLEGVSDSRVLELHKAVNEQEVIVDRLERRLQDVTEKIQTLERAADDIAELEQTRGQVTDQLTELRTRIERLESDAVEAFNEHIAELVDLLDYENLARVWIQSKDGSGPSDERESTFELHVVRTTDSGSTYEDSVNHLSESEREVVGLVFALAGYLVHEVYETVPFMLLDSLEAIDAERIALLIDYLEEYSPSIVAALLPEDASAVDESYRRIEDI